VFSYYKQPISVGEATCKFSANKQATLTIICNTMNVFAVILDQLNASLKNKSVTLFYKLTYLL